MMLLLAAYCDNQIHGCLAEEHIFLGMTHSGHSEGASRKHAQYKKQKECIKAKEPI